MVQWLRAARERGHEFKSPGPQRCKCQTWEGGLPCAQPWHTANIETLPCACMVTHGKPCRQAVRVSRLTHGKVLSCANIWPWVKVRFTVGEFAVCSSPWATHGKAFTVCNLSFAVCARHTANPSHQVVNGTISECDKSRGRSIFVIFYCSQTMSYSCYCLLHICLKY